jgi:ABC-type spermidine/putrescine transport system permease subunit I
MGRGQPSPYWALFVGPYGLYLLVFLALPFANVALLSVYLHSPTKIAIAEFTTANYAKLWELYYANLFFRTLRLSLTVTVVCVALGYPLAYLLARARPRIMTLGLFLLIMPLMVSTVIRVFGWVVILGNEGLVNQALRRLGAGDGVRLLHTEGAVIIGLAQQSMPFMVLPIMASIERISPSLEEAARNLGASWGQMFTRTILPLSMPGLLSGALLVFSVSMSAFVTPALMGGRRSRMVGQQIYEEVLSAYNWPGAASLTIVLALLMLGLVGLALWASRRRARLETAR